MISTSRIIGCWFAFCSIISLFLMGSLQWLPIVLAFLAALSFAFSVFAQNRAYVWSQSQLVDICRKHKELSPYLDDATMAQNYAELRALLKQIIHHVDEKRKKSLHQNISTMTYEGILKNAEQLVDYTLLHTLLTSLWIYEGW